MRYLMNDALAMISSRDLGTFHDIADDITHRTGYLVDVPALFAMIARDVLTDRDRNDGNMADIIADAIRAECIAYRDAITAETCTHCPTHCADTMSRN